MEPIISTTCHSYLLAWHPKCTAGHPAPLMMWPLLSCLALTLFTLYDLSLLHTSKALLSLYWTTCIYFEPSTLSLGLPRWLSSKESACSAGDAGDVGSTPVLGRSLEEGMATDSSILAWRIPWIEDLGGLKFIRSQRVGYDWSDWAHTFFLLHV